MVGGGGQVFVEGKKLSPFETWFKKVTLDICSWRELFLCIMQVGPSYGRRTLNGLLRSEGIVIGEQRIRQSLLHVTPVYTVQRRNHTYRRINPTPYYAEYHGHKIHLDQNEKLLQFGVTHVAASDGYSGKLLGIITMPKKNNLLIYDELFRYVWTTS